MRMDIEKIIIGSIIVAIGSSIAISIRTDHPEWTPTIFVTGVASVISYLAYRVSHEKVRLDLFERRWEVYEEILKYCSAVTRDGAIRDRDGNEEQMADAFKAAHGSFRGQGFHKAKALFGPDIAKLVNDLNDNYVWLQIYSDRPDDFPDWPKEQAKRMKFVWKTVETLPDVFRPYLYFGDIKNSGLTKLNTKT